MSLSRETTIVPGRDGEKLGSVGSTIEPITSISEASSQDNKGVRPSGEPNCTSRVLQNFSTVRERNAKRKATKFLDRWLQEDLQHMGTLENMREWNTSVSSGLKRVKNNAVCALGKKKRPSDDDLFKLTVHYFPPRGDIRIQIIDFCDGYTNRYDVTLKDLGDYVCEKPSEVDVRWIHAPLAQGVIKSCVNDIFLNALGERKASTLGKSKSWPYQAVESLSLQHRDEYRAKRDVHSALSADTQANERLRSRLDQVSGESLGPLLFDDLSWRCEHLGVKSGFWDLAATDVPFHLTQVGRLGTAYSPKDILNSPSTDHTYQTLWSHPFYEKAQLVRSLVKCYQRADDVLLTCSSNDGVDYLDKDLNAYLTSSKRKRMESEDISVLGFLSQRFADTGTRNWPEKTVEWFLVYLLTEFAVAPHNIRQGRNAMSLTFAYQQIVDNLKSRRYDAFKRYESVTLVRDFLTCIDELTSICLVLKGRISMLEQLRRYLQPQEENDVKKAMPETNTRCETALERVEWARFILNDQNEVFMSLLEDLRIATEALFQLKSIEQNELAIVADSQNRAIVVFTTVTVIFLPLTFFTGYFGMNLRGVQQTDKDEAWFWKVCGVVAFIVIILTTMWAFRYEIRRRIFGRNTIALAMKRKTHDAASFMV